MGIRLNPPQGKNKVSDWVGLRVVTNKVLRNSLIEVAEGSVGEVTEVRHGKGMSILFASCDCCGAKPFLLGVSDNDVSVFSED